MRKKTADTNRIGKERKLAEERVLIATERLQYLLSSATAIIYTSKASKNYGATFISDNVLRMTGYKPRNFMQKPNFWIKHIHPDDVRRIDAEVKRLLKTGHHRYEYRFRRKDGTYIWVSDEMKLIRNKSGKPLEIVGYWIDVTDRKRDEEERERLHKEIIRSNKKLMQLALKDPDTGLYNHRYLIEIIEAEFYRARRYAHPTSVIMIDIDYFKSVNELYGHEFGNMILKQLANQLKRMVRRYDVVVRFGGEEFIIISPGINRTRALIQAQRLLEALRLYNFGTKEHVVKLKLSMAVVSYPEDRAIKGIGLVELAEQILNKVKQEGGDRVYSTLDISSKDPVTSQKGDKPDVKFLKDKIEKLNKQGHQSVMEAILAFAKTIELRDHYTGEHVESTVHYATEIARALNLNGEEMESIRQAAILHDLGKVGISDKILLKKSKLTKLEFEVIKHHPQIAADIIRPIHFMHDIIPLILYHHERWDGKGYPVSLKGDEIPLGARIIAIADVYQALTSDRPYRGAYSKKDAIKIIKDGAGIQFDPKIVNIFLRILEKEDR